MCETDLVWKCLQLSFQSSVSHGDIQKFYFGKEFLEGLLIHAVYISSRVNSYNQVVLVGSSGVNINWKFQMLSCDPLVVPI